VDFFTKKQLAIQDVLLGQSHMLVLTKSGELYSSGMGSRVNKSNSLIKRIFLKNNLWVNIGALGYKQ
jgi:alpha-tubulin suppressor-like RCC1 family protein